MMRDTSFEALRALSMSRKAELINELCEQTRTTALAEICMRHPDYDEKHARWALWRHLYGDDLFQRVWPEAPLLAT